MGFMYYSSSDSELNPLGISNREHGMTRNTKALLYSALVFPGCGQFSLKRYKTSALFIGLSVIAIIYIIVEVVEKAHVIVGRIVAGEISPDYFVIRKLLMEQQNSADSNLLTIVLYSLIAIWLFSIIDILRLRFSESSNHK